MVGGTGMSLPIEYGNSENRTRLISRIGIMYINSIRAVFEP